LRETVPETQSEVNPPKTGVEFLSIATFLPVKRWVNVLPFLRMSSRVSAQLRETEVVRFGLKTNIPKKQFWTLSIWQSREAMRTFIGAEPHATAMKKFAQWAGDAAAFVEWSNTEGSINWEEAMEKLKKPDFYYRGETQPKK
jgi:hypothetical protein